MSLFSKKETVELSVSGMHCEKCVARVKDALENVDGVTNVDVSLEGNSATVEGHGIDSVALIEAIKAVGFEVALAE